MGSNETGSAQENATMTTETKKGKKGKGSNGATVERDKDGRPQLPKREAHNVQIGVRLSDSEEHKLLEEAAAAGCTSMSNYIRQKCGLPPLR